VVLATATRHWIFAAAMLFCVSARGTPFATTDQNPLFSDIGQPQPFDARLSDNGATSMSATLNWSSTAAIQHGANEDLIVDLESREWRMALEHVFADRFALRAEIPYRTLNGGTLDTFISHWHSAFGFPQGDRPFLPTNDFRIDYTRSGANVASFTNGVSGFGDASIALGYQITTTARAATSMWLNVKFPTGERDGLLGNGAYGFTLSLAQNYDLSRRWSTFAQANASYSTHGDLLPAQQRSFVWSGLVGCDYRYSRNLSLTVQLDAHTAAFKDSSLDLLGDAWILTFGGEYVFDNGWRAQFGLSEDVKVESSPDVTFVFHLVKKWK
jgi:hypothetical protein